MSFTNSETSAFRARIAMIKNTGSEKKNGVLYAARFITRVLDLSINPMEFKRVAMFSPMAVVPRISRQGGPFTIHPIPTKRVEEERQYLNELHRIINPANQKQKLLRELGFYGFNSATLFHDLDGLCVRKLVCHIKRGLARY